LVKAPASCVRTTSFGGGGEPTPNPVERFADGGFNVVVGSAGLSVIVAAEMKPDGDALIGLLDDVTQRGREDSPRFGIDWHANPRSPPREELPQDRAAV
jgi:hypothetical protein